MSAGLIASPVALQEADAPDHTRPVQMRRLAKVVETTLFCLFIFFICFTFLRPSPYDMIAVPTMLWLMVGLRIHRAVLVILGLLFVYTLSLVVALLPYLDEQLPVEWTYQFVYLAVTAVIFIAFFSDHTLARVKLGMQAYLASCLFAAICGILSYFDTFGTDVLFKMDGRASGVFEDPNLLGSFLILGVLYLLRGLLVGEARRPLLSIAGILLLVTAIFLSFSRGSWGALVLAVALMTAATLWSSGARTRRRVALAGTAALLLSVGVLGGLATVGDVAETFSDRFTLTKDYDEGETGRFGNQLRGIPMLFERPLGFGPLRWRQTFTLDPHNSYIGSFANGGWLGGFAFIGIVLTTSFVGFRLCLTPSPYQRYAQIVWPALFMFFLQAFQIDIEKWRHVYLMLGMLWGLEAARWHWQRQAGAGTTAPQTSSVSGTFTRPG